MLGDSEEHAGDRSGAGEVAEFVDKNDGIELLEIEFLSAEPGENGVAGFRLADEGEFRVHHAASGGGIEGQKFADFGSFLVGHFLEELLRSFFGKIGEEIGGGIRGHLFDDVSGLFGIEFFDDLRGESLVEFSENGRGGFLVERGYNALTFCGGKFFHHLGEIGGVEIFEFLVGDAELDAAQRVGFDKIDELPADGALREPGLQPANEISGSDALEQAAERSREANIDLSDAKFDIAVGAKFGEIDIVDADDLAAGGVDDLLIKKVFPDGEPGFVGLVGIEGALRDVEIDASWSDRRDLIVAGDEGLEASARDEEVRDAIGLIGGLDEEFADTADVVGIGIIGGGAHKFCGVEHRRVLSGGV